MQYSASGTLSIILFDHCKNLLLSYSDQGGYEEGGYDGYNDGGYDDGGMAVVDDGGGYDDGGGGMFDDGGMSK